MKKKLIVEAAPSEPAKAVPSWLTPWQKGMSGNPKGRPKGSKNKMKELADALIGNNASAIVKKIISMALAGDQACLKMCMDRILPAQRAIDPTLDKGRTEINVIVGSSHEVKEPEKLVNEPINVEVQEAKVH